MPYIKLQTNRQISDSKIAPLLEKLSSLTAGLLLKPENYVMVNIHDGAHMLFNGSTAPTAFIEFKCIRLPEEETPRISKKITTFISDELKIPADRIYIEFTDNLAKMWAYNGRTF